jgi:hypothetical protein
MTIHALWCHPRSVSTAFERIQRERGDLDVLHEPFMYDYYLNQTGRLFPDFAPDPDHPSTYVDTRNMIVRRSEHKPVFFKDMAYYVVKNLPGDPVFMGQMTHCFLVRDPAESIVSYHRRDPEFLRDEVGIDAQWRLYQALVAAGQDPLVITADALRADPARVLQQYWAHAGLPNDPRALEWDARVPKDWKSVKAWHKDALSSGAIRAADTVRDYRSEVAALGPVFAGYEAHHRPFYEALCKVAVAQNAEGAPHQK